MTPETTLLIAAIVIALGATTALFVQRPLREIFDGEGETRETIEEFKKRIDAMRPRDLIILYEFSGACWIYQLLKTEAGVYKMQLLRDFLEQNGTPWQRVWMEDLYEMDPEIVSEKSPKWRLIWGHAKRYRKMFQAAQRTSSRTDFVGTAG